MRQGSLIFLFISFGAASQSNDDLVKIDATKVNVGAGKEVLVGIVVRVKNGYHIQAHETADGVTIPTALEIAGDKNIVVKKQIFPPTKRFRLAGADQSLDVYDGEFEIEAYLLVSDRIQRGYYQLLGKLKYQACDSMRCLFPRTVEFLVNVDVQ